MGLRQSVAGVAALVLALAACGGSDLRLSGNASNGDGAGKTTLSVRGTLSENAPVFPTGTANIVVLVYSNPPGFERTCEGLLALSNEPVGGQASLEGEPGESFLVTGIPVGQLSVLFTRSRSAETTDNVIDPGDDVAALQDNLTGGAAGDTFAVDDVKIDFNDCVATSSPPERLN